MKKIFYKLKYSTPPLAPPLRRRLLSLPHAAAGVPSRSPAGVTSPPIGKPREEKKTSKIQIQTRARRHPWSLALHPSSLAAAAVAAVVFFTAVAGAIQGPSLPRLSGDAVAHHAGQAVADILHDREGTQN